MAAPSEDNKERETSNSHVGALLQASRQRLGEDLPDVAMMLRIRLPYLAAIEAGRYRELPGATYAVGFIRAYAEHLGLDSEEVVRRFKAETIDGGADQKLSFPTPVPETGIPGGAVVFVGIVVAVLAYGGWYLSTTKDGFFAELVSPVGEQFSNLLEDEKTAPTSSETPDAASTEPDTGAIESSESDESSVDNESPAEPSTAMTTETSVAKPALEAASENAESAAATSDQTAPQTQAEAQTDTPAPMPDAAAPSATTTSPSSPEPVVEEKPVGELEPAVADVEPTPEPDSSAPVTVAAVPAEPEARENTAPTPQVAAPAPTPVAATPSEPEVTPAPTPSEDSAAEAASAVAESAPVEAPTAAEPEAEAEDVAESEVSATPIITETEPAPVVEPAPPPPAPAQEAIEAPVSAVTETAAVPSAPAPVADDEIRITINAKNNSWIQVRDDVANKMLITRLLSAGDHYDVPNQPGLVLLTGNAGALEIVVDGEVVPSIGGAGVVRRSVTLEADRLKAGTAVEN